MGAVSSSLATISTGDGPPVVLVHGWSGYKESWGDLPDAIADAGRRAIAIDLPGTGGTPSPARFAHRPGDHADALLALLDATGPAALVAHSLGAQPALLAAARRPDLVGRLALLAPKVLPPDRRLRRPRSASHLVVLPVVGRRAAALGLRLSRRSGPRRLAAYRAAVAEPERIARERRSQDLLEDAAARLARADADALMATLDHGLRFDPRDLTPNVSQSVLVVVGERDPVLHPGQAVGLAAMLPNGRLHTVPACGHLPHLERPGEVVGAVVADLTTGAA